MSKNKKKHVLELIQKLQNGLASNNEIQYLSNIFLDKNKDNWPMEFESKEQIKESIYSKIQSNILKEEKSNLKVIPFYKKFYFKSAVAAAAVILISWSYFSLKEQNNVPIEESPQVVDTQIEKGTDKAILTLEDGSDIALEKGQEFTSNNLKSDGEKLVYVKKPKQKEEVEYNYLTIPRGGQFFIQLADDTKVWLNSESKLKYPVSFIKDETRVVKLIYGEAYFEVSPSTKHNGAKFIVKNKEQQIEVLGTEFNIKAYQDEPNIYTTLVEGKVNVKNNASSVTLQPNEQSIISSKDSSINVVTVDTYNETSWRDGVFSFESKSLNEIMKVMSRWYDMDVFFATKDLEEIKFIGVLSKDQGIKDILSTIENLGFINSYEIKNKYVILK